jgi:hypothetical protein
VVAPPGTLPIGWLNLWPDEFETGERELVVGLTGAPGGIVASPGVNDVGSAGVCVVGSAAVCDIGNAGVCDVGSAAVCDVGMAGVCEVVSAGVAEVGARIGPTTVPPAAPPAPLHAAARPVMASDRRAFVFIRFK